VVEGRAPASLARAAGMAVCFILYNETIKDSSLSSLEASIAALNFIHIDETRYAMAGLDPQICSARAKPLNRQREHEETANISPPPPYLI